MVLSRMDWDLAPSRDRLNARKEPRAHAKLEWNGLLDAHVLGYALEASRNRPIPRSHRLFTLTEPILPRKLIDPGELPLIVRDDGMAECDGVSGDEQVVAADRLTSSFESGA